MNKFIKKIGFLVAFGGFLTNISFAQSTIQPVELTPAPNKKVDKPNDPSATVDGKPAPQTSERSTLKPSTQYQRVNPADIRKMKPEELNPPPVEPAEKEATPVVTFGKDKPVNGTKTIKAQPKQRPVHPKPANSGTPETPKN
jgi:hypothetical protein